LVDVLAANKADGLTLAAAELAAQQYRNALASLARRANDETPTVLTCSALLHQGVDTVWTALEQRHARLAASGALAERRRRQNLHWLWNVVEDQVRTAVHAHPLVRSIRQNLEREVLEGTLPLGTAARQILEAFGIQADGRDLSW
jgi:LAO/AO transport system kinase